MSEDALWDAVRGTLSPFGRLKRVENRIDVGFPDVVYVLRSRPIDPPATGLVELKHEDAWPARARTPLTVRSLTREQVNFATSWALAGGRVATVLQVGRSYFAFDHRRTARLFAGELTRTDLESDPGVVWGENRFPAIDVLRYLTGPALGDAGAPAGAGAGAGTGGSGVRPIGGPPDRG